MTEVLLPPWVPPQSERATDIDDTTSVFRAAYAPGLAQRVSFVEPRLQVKQSYRSLRGFERAAFLTAIKGARGKFATVRALVGYALQGAFPAAELLSNPTFANGTTSWSAGSSTTLSVTNRALRCKGTNSASGTAPLAVQSPLTVVAGVPYVARALISDPNNAVPQLQLADAGIGGSAFGNSLATDGYLEAVYTFDSAQASFTMFNEAGGVLAGAYFDVRYTSLARCALVDNAQNLLLQTTTFNASPWTKTAVTVIDATHTAPDGTSTASGITETTANSGHFVAQPVTVPSADDTFTFGVVLSPNNRTWAYLQLTEGAGSTSIFAYFNLSSGAVGNTSTGANWTALRTGTMQLGPNTWYCWITGRKTNAATTLTATIGAASANGTGSYVGVASEAIQPWHAMLSQSAVPVRFDLVAQLGAANDGNGTFQSGNQLFLKGLPASTNNLLAEGDTLEIGGELKMVTARLDSDAAGLGNVQFVPALCRSPNDGDPVVIFQPMGKFILADNASWDNQYGVYLDADITLEAINE